MVAELAGQQDPGLGAFSCQEARKAWLDRHGNLDEAVEECVRARRKKVPLCGKRVVVESTRACLLFPLNISVLSIAGEGAPVPRLWT